MFKKNEANVVYQCTVRLLDDSEIVECEFQPIHKGLFLLEFLCQQLHIKEKDYFGLRYVDASKQRHWLDLSKSILKQCKDIEPLLFSFRVKFYPADPFRVTGVARHMLYQQLKRDLRHGRLYCSQGEAAALGALIVQEELGDYEEDIHNGDYVSSLELSLRQTNILEKKIMELHKKREKGQNPNVAIEEFLSIARNLETYGIDPYAVKDHRGSQLYIGVNYAGISTFVAGKRSQHFHWNEVHKINFEGKMFIIHLSYTDASREPKKHTIGFKCSSGAACRYIWRCSIEQMLFFTLPNASNASVISGGGFFSWGTKFKYSGRTEREILTESISNLREQKLTYSGLSNRKANSVPATPSSPSDLEQIRYSSLPRSTMSEPLGHYVTDCMGNIIYGSNHHDRRAVGPSKCLEPLSEAYTTHNNHNSNSVHNVSSNKQISHIDKSNSHYALTQQAIPDTTINSTINSTFESSLHGPTGSRGLSANPNSSNLKYNNAVKSREFNFVHAFIPSFIFVVILMLVSVVLILESELSIFERIRTMPEMISLRYQYYLPLKEFLNKKFN